MVKIHEYWKKILEEWNTGTCNFGDNCGFEHDPAKKGKGHSFQGQGRCRFKNVKGIQAVFNMLGQNMNAFDQSIQQMFNDIPEHNAYQYKKHH